MHQARQAHPTLFSLGQNTFQPSLSKARKTSAGKSTNPTRTSKIPIKSESQSNKTLVLAFGSKFQPPGVLEQLSNEEDAKKDKEIEALKVELSQAQEKNRALDWANDRLLERIVEKERLLEEYRNIPTNLIVEVSKLSKIVRRTIDEDVTKFLYRDIQSQAIEVFKMDKISLKDAINRASNFQNTLATFKQRAADESYRQNYLADQVQSVKKVLSNLLQNIGETSKKLEEQAEINCVENEVHELESSIREHIKQVKMLWKITHDTTVPKVGVTWADEISETLLEKNQAANGTSSSPLIAAQPKSKVSFTKRLSLAERIFLRC